VEIFSSVVALSLLVLAIYMYFKTRERPRSPLVGLDLARFSPVAEGSVAERVRDVGRGAAGVAPEEAGDEHCETDGERFLYRAAVGRGPKLSGVKVLLDRDFRVVGSARSVAM
jgi:hypothetical protein